MVSVFRAFLLIVLALAVSPAAQAEDIVPSEQTPEAVLEQPVTAPTEQVPLQPPAQKAKNPAAPGKIPAKTPDPAKSSAEARHILGLSTAPVKVDVYSSLTCSHCAIFHLDVLPELEKRYIETGKVRLVLHDFPLNAIGLKAAAVARCMPKDVYFPFIKTLYGALKSGAFGANDSENTLFQYAALGGLPAGKAKACANNVKLQEAIIADRAVAAAKYNIEATPTFVINDGAEIVSGALGIEAYAAAFDRQLAAVKK